MERCTNTNQAINSKEVKGISLQISKENGTELSPEFVELLLKEGWSIDNIEHF